MAKRFVLKIWDPSDGGAVDYCGYAYVEVTPALMDVLRERRKVINDLSKQDDDEFLSVQYMSNWVYWREDADEDPLEEATTEYIKVKEMPEDGKDLRVDSERMIVERNGVHWSAVVKHTSVEISSGFIPWKQLGL